MTYSIETCELNIRQALKRNTQGWIDAGTWLSRAYGLGKHEYDEMMARIGIGASYASKLMSIAENAVLVSVSTDSEALSPLTLGALYQLSRVKDEDALRTFIDGEQWPYPEHDITAWVRSQLGSSGHGGNRNATQQRLRDKLSEATAELESVRGELEQARQENSAELAEALKKIAKLEAALNTPATGSSSEPDGPAAQAADQDTPEAHDASQDGDDEDQDDECDDECKLTWISVVAFDEIKGGCEHGSEFYDLDPDDLADSLTDFLDKGCIRKLSEHLSDWVADRDAKERTKDND